MNIRRTITATAIAAAMAGLSMGLAAGSAVASEHDAVESNGCNAQQDKDSANSCSGVDDHKKDGDKVADANGCGGPNGCGAEK